jgi:hypothetical protein
LGRYFRLTAAGFLAASTLLGAALAAAPAMDHEGHAAMQQDVAPRMQQDGTLRKIRPAPWDVVKLTAARTTRPAPWDEAVPAPWEI